MRITASRQPFSLLHLLMLILTFSSSLSSNGFPVIRPVPCKNAVTEESGICMFNWSCTHVAHGVHIAPCMDGYLIGSCCKLSKSAQKGASWSFQEVSNHSMQQKQQEWHQAQISEGSIYSVYEILSSNFQKKAQTKRYPTMSSKWVSLSGESFSREPNLSEKKPVINFFAENEYKTTASENMQNHLITETSQRRPVSLEPSHDMRRPVFLELSHNMRVPVVPVASHNMRNTEPSFNMFKPIVNDSNANRPTVPHDLNQPILSDMSHNMHESTVVKLPLPPHYLFQELPQNPDLVKPNMASNDSMHDDLSSSTTTGLESSGIATNITLEMEKPVSELGNIFELSSHGSPEQLTNDTFEGFPSHTSLLLENFPIDEYFVNSDSKNSVDGIPILPLSTTDTSAIDPDMSSQSLLSAMEYTDLKKFHSFEFKDASAADVSSHKNTMDCGISRNFPIGRIVGGQKSSYLKWPWMISLHRLEGKTFKHKCGAALINQLWAVTVAHCVDRKLPNEIVLHLGDYNLHDTNEFHPHVEMRVFLMIVHPNFDPLTYENDLALLRFYQPIQNQPNIAPVCLPKVSDDFHGKFAVVTGWGRLSEDGELPGYLHEVRLPILTNRECEEMYSEAGYVERISDVFLCAGSSVGGLDACEGDSGGPMVVMKQGKWHLAGLISWGMGCATPRQPGVYTRISKFVKWIEEITSI